MHNLIGIELTGVERFLGQYENFFNAIEACESEDVLMYSAFKVTNGEKIIIGTRMAGTDSSEIFWRIPRKTRRRGRDSEVWDKFRNLVKSKL